MKPAKMVSHKDASETTAGRGQVWRGELGLVFEGFWHSLMLLPDHQVIAALRMDAGVRPATAMARPAAIGSHSFLLRGEAGETAGCSWDTLVIDAGPLCGSLCTVHQP